MGNAYMDKLCMPIISIPDLCVKFSVTVEKNTPRTDKSKTLRWKSVVILFPMYIDTILMEFSHIQY